MVKTKIRDDGQNTAVSLFTDSIVVVIASKMTSVLDRKNLVVEALTFLFNIKSKNMTLLLSQYLLSEFA